MNKPSSFITLNSGKKYIPSTYRKTSNTEESNEQERGVEKKKASGKGGKMVILKRPDATLKGSVS